MFQYYIHGTLCFLWRPLNTSLNLLYLRFKFLYHLFPPHYVSISFTLRSCSARHTDGSATYYDNDARIVTELPCVELNGTKLTVAKEQFDKYLQKLIATGRRV
ncbi:MAG: hypothetical protein K6A78_07405 [Prevotella sp.]|nr:hypothetical protein [Prevotella sp.]